MVTIIYTLYASLLPVVGYRGSLFKRISDRVMHTYRHKQESFLYRYFEYPTNISALSVYGVIYSITLAIDWALIQLYINRGIIYSFVQDIYNYNPTLSNIVIILTGLVVLGKLLYRSSLGKVWIEDFTGRDEDTRREVDRIYLEQINNKTGNPTLVGYISKLSPSTTQAEIKKYFHNVGYNNLSMIEKLSKYISTGDIKEGSKYDSLIRVLFTTNYYEECIQKIAFNRQMGLDLTGDLLILDVFLKRVRSKHFDNEFKETKSIEKITKEADTLIKKIKGVV